MFQYALAAKSVQANPKIRTKFVEGTTSQLAKYLYNIQAEAGMCSLRAIQTASNMLGGNTDREPIIRSASVAAEQLATQKMQLMSQSRPVEVPAYMHAKELKIALIEEMRVKIEEYVIAQQTKEAKDLLGEQQKLQQELKKSIFTEA